MGELRLLDVREVAELLGIAVRTAWRLLALAESGQGDFPKPVRLTPKIVRWRLTDVEQYLEDLALPGGSR